MSEWFGGEDVWVRISALLESCCELLILMMMVMMINWLRVEGFLWNARDVPANIRLEAVVVYEYSFYFVNDDALPNIYSSL